jgi:hypothetical protein
MAKLPEETTETIWSLKRQLLDIVDEATAAEAMLFSRYGETSEAIFALDELKSIAEQAVSRFSQLSSLQLRIAESQPTVTPDMLKLVTEVIAHAQANVPALERSVQEIKLDWSLL